MADCLRVLAFLFFSFGKDCCGRKLFLVILFFLSDQRELEADGGEHVGGIGRYNYCEKSRGITGKRGELRGIARNREAAGGVGIGNIEN